jgi:hypothetical protein
VVIGDFNLKCVAVTPNEADPELIVDPDTMLSFAVALQCFQAISREKSQIRELPGGMYLNEFSLNHLSKPIEAFGISTLKMISASGDRNDRIMRLQCTTLYVPRQGVRQSRLPTAAYRRFWHSGSIDIDDVAQLRSSTDPVSCPGGAFPDRGTLECHLFRPQPGSATAHCRVGNARSRRVRRRVIRGRPHPPRGNLHGISTRAGNLQI